eukprot:GAHX01000025.1.p1 GENE.GAHX01000025.1~~GAHX01000025.1.p1  ORF type:complete len:395 (+),score=45.09 GAHX01000025.1:111-1295(+)
MRKIIGGAITAVVCIGVIVLITFMRGGRRSTYRTRTQYTPYYHTTRSYSSYRTPSYSYSWSRSKTKTTTETETETKSRVEDFYSDPIPTNMVTVGEKELDSVKDGEGPSNTLVFLRSKLTTEQLDKLCKDISEECEHLQAFSSVLAAQSFSIQVKLNHYKNSKILTKENLYLFIRLQQLYIYSKTYHFVMDKYKAYLAQSVLKNKVKTELICLKSIVFKQAFDILDGLASVLRVAGFEVIDEVYQQKYTEDKTKKIAYLVNHVQLISMFIPKEGYVEDLETVPQHFTVFKHPESARYVIIVAFAELFLRLMNSDIQWLEMTSVFDGKNMQALIKPEMRTKLGGVIRKIRQTYHSIAFAWLPDLTAYYMFDTLEERITSFLKEVAVLDDMFIGSQ